MATKKTIIFEQAQAELDTILEELRQEDTPLDTALKLYARAATLIADSDAVLQKAQLTIEEIDAKLAQTLAQDTI